MDYVSKREDDGQNRGRILIPGRGWRAPVYWPTGLRHIRGETTAWALAWNVGTCRGDVKGACQAGSPRKALSTKALHRGGSSRSSDEGSVMELERRGRAVQQDVLKQPNWGGL